MTSGPDPDPARTVPAACSFRMDLLEVAIGLKIDAALALRLRGVYALRFSEEASDETSLAAKEAGELLASALSPDGDARLAALPLHIADIDVDGSLTSISRAEALGHPLTHGFQPTFGAQLGWVLERGAMCADGSPGPVVRGRLAIQRGRERLSAVMRLDLNETPHLAVVARFGEDPLTSPLHMQVHVDLQALFAAGVESRALERPAQPGGSRHMVQVAMATARASDAVVH